MNKGNKEKYSCSKINLFVISYIINLYLFGSVIMPIPKYGIYVDGRPMRVS